MPPWQQDGQWRQTLKPLSHTTRMLHDPPHKRPGKFVAQLSCNVKGHRSASLPADVDVPARHALALSLGSLSSGCHCGGSIAVRATHSDLTSEQSFGPFSKDQSLFDRSWQGTGGSTRDPQAAQQRFSSRFPVLSCTHVVMSSTR